MKLIEFDGEQFKIADEALLVRSIRELFQQDKSKKKEDFWRQISYMWFMYDPRSPYMYIVKPENRAVEVKRQEGFGEDWNPSEQLNAAMEDYRRQCVTTAALLLEGMRKGIENVRSFLENVNLTAVDKSNKPIYQVSTITSALKQVPELAKALVEAEKALAKDFSTEDRARGTTEKAAGEDW